MSEKQFDPSNITAVWEKFEQGKNNHNEHNLYSSTERAYRFYEGDQWYGMNSSEPLPVLNFIKPTVNYKVSMVAMNTMQIQYSPEDLTPEALSVCEALNKYATQTWEYLKMDSICWRIIREACVAGDAYIYFYDKDLHCQVINNTDIYFADEQSTNIQSQPYILIYERRPCSDIRREAKANGIKKEDIEKIIPDQSLDTIVGDIKEVKNGDGKCGSVLFFTRNASGDVVFSRSTKYVIYQPEQTQTGIKKYPIANLVWSPIKNSSRGWGEVKPLIQNQFEVNKLLVRRCRSAAMNAFAKPVYMENMIMNPEDISTLGKGIAIRGNGSVQSVKDYFDYIAPAPMSQEANLLQTDIITNSRELAGAGSAALGQFNPSRASGEAIMAIQDQAAIPLNENTAVFRQFVEDVAIIWLDHWRVYNREGIRTSELVVDPVTKRKNIVTQDIEGEALDIAMTVKIDATSTNPYSRFAEEQSVEVARNAGYISFEEYVESLPYNSMAPKAKFEDILAKRRKQQEAEQQAQAQAEAEAIMSGSVPPMPPMSEGEPEAVGSDQLMPAKGTTMSKNSGMITGARR